MRLTIVSSVASRPWPGIEKQTRLWERMQDATSITLCEQYDHTGYDFLRKAPTLLTVILQIENTEQATLWRTFPGITYAC
jgi:hypothetical protein